MANLATEISPSSGRTLPAVFFLGPSEQSLNLAWMLCPAGSTQQAVKY